MSRDPRKRALVSVVCLGLCLIAAVCGTRQRSDQAGQSDRAVQGQAPSKPARILTNQVGYEPSGTKKAVIQGHAGDAFAASPSEAIPGGEVVLSGAPVHVGPVAKWKDWDFWTVDWSAVKDEGTYVIECSPRAITAGEAAAGKAAPGAVRSHPVLVQKNALARNTLSDVIYYFKGQRSSGLWDKADRTMTFDGQAPARSTSTAAGSTPRGTTASTSPTCPTRATSIPSRSRSRPGACSWPCGSSSGGTSRLSSNTASASSTRPCSGPTTSSGARIRTVRSTSPSRDAARRRSPRTAGSRRRRSATSS